MVFVCFANIGRVDRLPTFAISNHGRFAASVANDLAPSDLAAAVSESPVDWYLHAIAAAGKSRRRRWSRIT
jgi:hypothetical protein